jgi:Fe-S-cluster-containing hydrogenase component 2
MIGCPVGSINRGDDGEIIIRDWCIGCGMCADQCPYGSIQMTSLSKPVELSDHERSLLPPDCEIRAVTKRAVVCDLCSSLSTGPACVYACPHDAARRENASVFFFQD